MKILFYLALLFNAMFALDFSSIRADFIQKIKGDDGVIEYSGHLIATADSKAYWRYGNPIKKEIFVNKNKVVIYEPELKQAIISEKLNLDFLSILNSVKESNGELISEINNQVFRVILKDKIPSKVLYKDELDNDIEITLKNVVLNEKIDYKKFQFKLPSDTEMIYE